MGVRFEIFGRGGLFCGYVVVPLCGKMSVSPVRQSRVSFEMYRGPSSELDLLGLQCGDPGFILSRLVSFPFATNAVHGSSARSSGRHRLSRPRESIWRTVDLSGIVHTISRSLVENENSYPRGRDILPMQNANAYFCSTVRWPCDSVYA